MLYDDLSLIEHLQYIGGLHGVDGDELDARGRALLERFNLTDRADDLPVTFSRACARRRASPSASSAPSAC